MTPHVLPSPGSEAYPQFDEVTCLTSRIHLGFHLLPHIVHTVLDRLPSSTYVLVTDTHLARLYLPSFADAFQAEIERRGARSRFLSFAVPPGEESKSREGKAQIEDYLLENKVTRDAVVLALGGGVIGDLVGFVAATFMRGLRFCQIPTTLLAMVDSSVGGKTAIDTPAGKNLIGAFWQPSFIFIDAAFLETLPEREFSNGMAEVVKTAAIWDAEAFAKLENASEAIRSAVLSPPKASSPSAILPGTTLRTRTAEQTLLLDVVRSSVAVKSFIVTKDERETGLRNLVNFGHTIGHAIEAVLTPDMLHGECVSVGMILEAEVSRSLGHLSQVAVGRLTRCLKAYSLPTSITDPRIVKLSRARGLATDKLLDIMRIDKKNAGDEKKIVLLSRIGQCVEERATAVKDEVIRRVLCPAVRVTPVSRRPGHASVNMATPGSKSISNRALVLAALGKGTCRVRNLLHSDDTQVMIAALQDLKGASFDFEDGGDTIVVHGGGGRLTLPEKEKEIYLGNAGTAARFMTTVCALVSPGEPSSPSGRTVITGNARMKQRPVGPLVDALTANGVDVRYLETQGSLPLSIAATETGLRGGHIRLAASISSQYVSSILLCAPYAAEEVKLELTGGQVISQPYIDMTIAMMRDFGVSVERLVDETTGRPSNVYRVPRSCYVNPATYDVESDASSATYPLAIAAITGTECTIPNVGSASLQGDARFAKDVLEPMGCEVVQTTTSTTVRGPPVGQLRALGEIDMEPMTDAFLTASALAAVASRAPLEGRPTTSNSSTSSTRIRGIANQRVKECNRIAAMMDQLAKFGVRTQELEDGLEIFPIEVGQLNTDASIECYDDHRVAMAFSVLASICPVVDGDGKEKEQGVVIEEKRCVEKTWPNWWDDLERKIGVHVSGVDLDAHAHTGTSASVSLSASEASCYPAEGSILLIGMRAVGKTHLGSIGARALGPNWTFLDADVAFEQRHGRLDVFVKNHGWPAFREAETALLEELLARHPTGYVLSLGGGIVETPRSRELLKSWGKTKGPVVHVKRDIEEIVAFLSSSDRPAYGEGVRDVFQRRWPWFEECSTCELVNYTGASVDRITEVVKGVGSPQGSSQEQGNGVPPAVEGDRNAPENLKGRDAGVARFFRFVGRVETNQVALDDKAGRRSYFVCLTFPDLRPALPSIERITAGVDAIELRVDLLHPSGKPTSAPHVPPKEYVALQLAALRQWTSLPIVYTVRTVSQGGMFPDGENEKYFELLELGLRLAVEYLDLEVRFPVEMMMDRVVTKKGATLIIASWHDWAGRDAWSSRATREKYDTAARVGDVIKLINKADSLSDNFELEKFRASIAHSGKPLLAINMGEKGQMSRILNPNLTPVTHRLLPSAAAPGQVSFAQIQQALHLLGQLPKKNFYLFGTPIAHSMSPTLHNTGFAELGLPHLYALHETGSIDESCERILRSPDFGGASVTIPHKLDVMRFLDVVSPEAKIIGAVNTVVPRIRSHGDKSGTSVELYGDNTDWQGIVACVQRRLPYLPLSAVGLVLGAGGTSRAAIYALHQLGIRTILLYNRTPENARRVAEAFDKAYGVVMLESLEDEIVRDGGKREGPTIVISTVPSSGTLSHADGQDVHKGKAGVILPSSLFSNPRGGVAIDMSYKPERTPLLDLAKQASATGGTGAWMQVPGLEVLLEQGYGQFRAWTQREAPEGVIRSRVWQWYRSMQ